MPGPATDHGVTDHPATAPSATLVVTGTDTGIGKTGVTAAILRTLAAADESVGALKMACSGVGDEGRWDDVEQLLAALDATDQPAVRDRVGPWCFDAPLAPPQAARAEGRTLTPEDITAGRDRWGGRCDVLVAEGVGGLLCPLTDSTTVADAIAEWDAVCIAVVGLRLGAINHALMTAEVAASRRLRLAGWVMNELTPPTDPDAAALTAAAAAEIARRSGVAVLAVRRFGEDRLRPPSGRGTIDAAAVRKWLGSA